MFTKARTTCTKYAYRDVRIVETEITDHPRLFLLVSEDFTRQAVLVGRTTRGNLLFQFARFQRLYFGILLLVFLRPL